jgi:leucyl aminopeptidase (aminopeptidase T)
MQHRSPTRLVRLGARHACVALAGALAVSIAASASAQVPSVTQAGSAEVSAARDPLLMANAPALASRIVQSLGIKPDQFVVIQGGVAVLPAMEAIAIEAQRAGARTLTRITTERIARFRAAELPEQYLGRLPSRIDSTLIRDADFWIELPEVTDAGIYSRDVSETRLAKMRSSQGAWAALWAGKSARRLFVNLPQPSDTVGFAMSADAYRRAAWGALTADYREIARVGTTLQRALAGARRVRVTSPEGTDITFGLAADRAVVVDAGGVDAGTGPSATSSRALGLPGGGVSVATVEGSANGRVRAAMDNCEQMIRDEAIDVKDGKPTSVRAASDEACLKKAMDGIEFSSLGIGLNPAARLDSAYTPLTLSGEGVVLLGFGYNKDLGGSVTNTKRWIVPLMRATLTADDKVIVRDGKLVR